MRAFGTFLILVLGLATGGFSGYRLARLTDPSKAETIALERALSNVTDELAATKANLAAAEMMVDGSSEVLANYTRQIRMLEALLANSDTTVGEEQVMSVADLRAELNRAYALIDRLQSTLADEQNGASASPSNPLLDDF